MNDNQKELIRITSEYFEDEIDFVKLLERSKAYKKFLNKLSGQDLDTDTGRGNIQFDNGKAIGTFWAAFCIDDFIRTRNFIRGIDKAIKQKLNEKESIQILYAGTGPFATLLLPLILRHSKQRITYKFLEINPLTIDVLQKVISNLELEEYDIECIHADATKYQIGEEKPDIIVSETMQNALANEQQVPVFLNLMNQVSSDTIFIPEKIEIFVGLFKIENSSTTVFNKYHKENKIFEVSKEALLSEYLMYHKNRERIFFPKEETIITNQQLKEFNQLIFITEIQVFKDEIIKINDSGLTTPLLVENISCNFKEVLTINTQYKIGEVPKLDFEIVYS